MSIDCGFFQGKQWFRYRAAGIIIEDGAVLFAGNPTEPYYYSVGGGVHAGETAEDAVRREVYEETGVHYQVDRLAVIHENFFWGHGGEYEGVECHEICFYFLMVPRGTRALNSHSISHDNTQEEMHWVPVSDLGKVYAYPTFLAEYLSAPHPEIVHIVSDERQITP